MFFRDADAPIFRAVLRTDRVHARHRRARRLPRGHLPARPLGSRRRDEEDPRVGIVVVGLIAGGRARRAAGSAVIAGVSGDIAPSLRPFGAVLATVFLLVRTRAQRLASRLVYGKRSTPYEVLSEFGERVGGTYSLDDVLPRMATLLGEATGAGPRAYGCGSVTRSSGGRLARRRARRRPTCRFDDASDFAGGRRLRGTAPGRAPRRAHVVMPAERPDEPNQGQAGARHGGAGGSGAAQRPPDRGAPGLATAPRGGPGRGATQARARHARRRATAVGRAHGEARPRWGGRRRRPATGGVDARGRSGRHERRA